jgi:hypothetical protein
MSASEKRYRRVAPVSKDGAAPWFETPRTRSANLGRPKIAAPHHEAGTDHVCIQLIGNRFSSVSRQKGAVQSSSATSIACRIANGILVGLEPQASESGIHF